MSVQKNFYDILSEDYDSMINFEASLSNKVKMFEKFITDDMKRAADFGCGTGADSIALSKLGLDVTGFDISDNMINKAKKNAGSKGFDIDFIATPLDKVDTKRYKDFNFIVSIGNTLSNLSPAELRRTISKMHKMLSDKGSVLIQVLNYYPVLKEQKGIVSITEKDDIIYFRMYDFKKAHLNFNILKVNKTDPSEYSFIQTKIYPHLKDSYTKLLSGAGFKRIKFYSDLNTSKFKKNSKDLIIMAVK